MKTLKNKMTKATKEGVPQDFVGLMRMCLDCPPPGGFTFEDLRKRIRIEKNLDAAVGVGAILELEDNDADNLKQIVNDMRWGARHPDLLVFADAIEAL